MVWARLVRAIFKRIGLLTFRPSPSAYVLLGTASLVGGMCSDGHDAMYNP